MGIGSLRRILVFQDVKKLIPIPILKFPKKLLGMFPKNLNRIKNWNEKIYSKENQKLKWKELF